MPTEAEKRLEKDEMIEILEDLARNSGSATARIQAIKTLREMSGGEQPADNDFAELDELAPRRRKTA